MLDETGSSPQTRHCRMLEAAVGLFWVLVVMRFAVQGGSRSSPGYNRRSKFAQCPKCGENVRLEADGWGYCYGCDIEFEFEGK
jgi:hypothetical protein